MGRGAPSVAQRSAPLRSMSAAIGIFGRRQIAECTVWTDVVVIVLPSRQDGADLGKRGEQRLVEEFVAQPAVETLDEGVLGRLAGRDLVPLDPYLLTPAQDRHAGQLGAVVGDAHGRTAARGNDCREFAHDPQSRQRRVGEPKHLSFAGPDFGRPVYRIRRR